MLLGHKSRSSSKHTISQRCSVVVIYQRLYQPSSHQRRRNSYCRRRLRDSVKVSRAAVFSEQESRTIRAFSSGFANFFATPTVNPILSNPPPPVNTFKPRARNMSTHACWQVHWQASQAEIYRSVRKNATVWHAQETRASRMVDPSPMLQRVRLVWCRIRSHMSIHNPLCTNERARVRAR
jgi:hypothetical protein